MLLSFGSPSLQSIPFTEEHHHLLPDRCSPLTSRIRTTPAPPHTIFTPTPISLNKTITARWCLHTRRLGHHPWQPPHGHRGFSPSALARPRLRRKGRATRGECPGGRGEPTPQEVRRGWCPRTWSHQLRQRSLKGKSHKVSPPPPFLVAQSLPLSALPPPSLAPAIPLLPLCLPLPHLRLLEHPGARRGRRSGQLPGDPGPAPPRPRPDPPLPGLPGTGSHPEEQVEAEQQVLDAPQAPAEAPHAAAPAAGSRVPRPALGAPGAAGAGGEGAEREGPWAGPSGGGAEGRGPGWASGGRGRRGTPRGWRGVGAQTRWRSGCRKDAYPALPP